MTQPKNSLMNVQLKSPLSSVLLRLSPFSKASPYSTEARNMRPSSVLGNIRVEDLIIGKLRI